MNELDLDDELEDMLDDALLESALEEYEDETTKVKVWQDYLNHLPLQEKLNIVKTIEEDVRKQANEDFTKQTLSPMYRSGNPKGFIRSKIDKVSPESVLTYLTEQAIQNSGLKTTDIDAKEVIQSVCLDENIQSLLKKQLRNDINRRLRIYEKDKANILADKQKFKNCAKLFE